MSFATFGFSEEIVRAVFEHGYIQPTPHSGKGHPSGAADGDSLAGAQTGTCMTAGSLCLSTLFCQTYCRQNADLCVGVHTYARICRAGGGKCA